MPAAVSTVDRRVEVNKMEDLTVDTFDETIESGVTLVDFWAEWCGPCKMLLPTLEELEEEFSGRASVAKVNVAEEASLAAKMQVRGIPVLVLFKDGEVVQRFTGTLEASKANLAAALENTCS
jgi:thioredoxin 1